MSPLLLAVALAAASGTKLGVYVAGDDATSQALLAAPGCPQLTVFPAATSSMAQAAAFRAACPMSKVVAQVGDAGMTVSAAVAEASWPIWYTLLGNNLGFGNFDVVEGPPEPAGMTADVAAFWAAFAAHVQQLPKIPVVGSLATGTLAPAFCPTATAVNALGLPWAWSYHAFSTSLTQDLPTETATTLGYRAIRDGCGLAGVAIYLTQAGPAPGRSWQAGDVTWLGWLDGQLAVDGAVVGAALYEAGGTDRSLAPVSAQLVSYLQSARATDGGTGSPGLTRESGCATAGAGYALLAVLPLLWVARRRRAPGGPPTA
ncbi:MAG TPA: hypothetical protein VF805_15740 [Anaeromyxobacteraceae bacterium]